MIDLTRSNVMRSTNNMISLDSLKKSPPKQNGYLNNLPNLEPILSFDLSASKCLKRTVTVEVDSDNKPRDFGASGSSQSQSLSKQCRKNVPSTIGQINIKEEINFVNKTELKISERSVTPVRQALTVKKQLPSVFIIESLVWNICSYHENDPELKKKLYSSLCKLLIENNVFGSSYLDESLQPLRDIFAKKFNDEIFRMRKNILETSGGTNMSPYVDLNFLNYNSFDMMGVGRYYTEFDEICEIATGGFGVVKKARHRIDKCVYAVKKIAFSCKNDNSFKQIMREVTLLANLNPHSNVVAYKTAWIQDWSVKPARSRTSSKCYSKDFETKIVDLNESSYSPNDSNSTMEAQLSHDGDAHQFLSTKKYKDKNQNDQPKSDITDDYVCFENRNLTDISEVLEQDDDESFCSSDDDDSDNSEDSSSCEMVLEESDANLPDNMFTDKSCQLMCQELVRAKPTYQLPPLHRRFRAVLYIQMELCGENLRTYLDYRNAKVLRPTNDHDELDLIDIEMELNIFKQILNGVQYIHSQNLIHRDLKPPNILFGLDHLSVKIGDFGLATLHHQAKVNDDEKIVELNGFMEEVVSETGEQHTGGLGTSIYAAPEQQMGVDYDNRVDMFSLGIILFELLQPILTEMERVKIIEKLKRRILPENFTKRWPLLAEIILKLTNSSKNERPNSIEELFRMLRTVPMFKCDDDVLVNDTPLELKSKEQLIQEVRLLKKENQNKDRHINELKQQIHNLLVLTNNSSSTPT